MRCTGHEDGDIGGATAGGGGGSWRVKPPVQPGSFAEVELDAPASQLSESCYSRIRMGTDKNLKDGLPF